MDEFFRKYIVTDAHVHIGDSKDGHRASEEDLFQYYSLGIDEFVVFPFNERDMAKTKPFYRLANARISELAGRPGIIGFMRLYPANFSSVHDARSEMEQWKSFGLMGVKLRPGRRGDCYDILKDMR